MAPVARSDFVTSIGFGTIVLTERAVVEVAGIEPASSAVLTGLLRAQCAVSLLGPVGHTHKPT
jgi:hypothetical protein